MAWIKFEKDLQTDPRVLRLARALETRWQLSEETTTGKDFAICNAPALPAVTLACGALVRLWCLADTHVAEDDILRLSTGEIDTFIGLPGFCSLMPNDWLVDHGDTVELPGFHLHNGTLAKKRAVTQKRVAKHRVGNAAPLQRVTPEALPDQTRPDQTRKREEPRSQGSRLPPDWQPPEDLKAWAVKERPDLDLDRTLAKFRDYWIAKPGKAGTKLDWSATFRNWVREEKSGNGSTPPLQAKVKKCRYCSAPAIASVGGIDHCREHSDEAYDRKAA